MLKIASLTDRGLLELSGQDTAHFLQNIITCDVENLPLQKLTFGALLTPQGKILFDFFLLREGDNRFLLDSAKSHCDALLKRLTFYKLRADVTIEKLERPVFALWGEAIPIGLQDPRTPTIGTRLYGPLPDGYKANTDENLWHGHRIYEGVPELDKDFTSATIFPHEALMDQFQQGGIDFNKGCYVGQEVVSRMQHRGTARSRFMKVIGLKGFSNTLNLPPCGSAIMAQDKTIGTLGSCFENQGLALMRLDRAHKALQQKHAINVIDKQTGQNITLGVAFPPFANFAWPQ